MSKIKNDINLIDGTLSKAMEKILALKKSIMEMINALPDNPKIKRLNKNCFIINFSDLSMKNWTPIYYDFKRQYEAINEIIENCAPEDIDNKIKKIIETGKIMLHRAKTIEDAYNQPNYSFIWGLHPFHFHPEVIKNLKSIY